MLFERKVMTKSRSYVRIKTQNGNRYILDDQIRKSILCHPLFYIILEMVEKGIDVHEWLAKETGDLIDITEIGSTPKSEILYYYKKLQMLSENGYFKSVDQKEELSGKITPEDVKHNLANPPIITFEVTDRCNLKCKYCGYGEFYSNYDQRQNRNLDIKLAKKLLLYLQELWNSPLNISHDRNIYIGFYGGEPLMNFPFINGIISFLKDFKLHHNRLSYSITTNGLLLDKHIDFLQSNDFNLLISLDGSEMNNSYRTTESGYPSFYQIMENIRNLKNQFPGYFKKKVNFNSVIHNKNSIPEVFKFFKEQFNKFPTISSLNTNGIKKEQIDAFRKTYSNPLKGFWESDDYSTIENEMFIKLPNIKSLTTFLHNKTDFTFRNYNELIYPQNKVKLCPTGTCSPFMKKIFVTVSGSILCCERIGTNYKLGEVSEKGVTIDFEGIANRYNQWFDKIREQCSTCYNSSLCDQCLFYLPLEDTQPLCNKFMNYQQYSSYVSSQMEYLEKNPEIYQKIFKKVRVG